jgi:hypothetical protein
MPDFTELPVYAGVGDFHFNRFRIAFSKPAGLSARDLAQQFVSNFPYYFNSPYAKVVPGVRTFNSKPTLKFHGYVKVLGIDVGRPHNDWVVQEWVDNTVGFTAQTLKREFFDAAEDGAMAAAALAAGGLIGMEPAPTVVGGVVAAHYNRMHLLAGRRSWRLDDGQTFGVTGDLLVLETIAVERFSAEMYRLGDKLGNMRAKFPDIWIANLNNFVRLFRDGLKLVSQPLKPGWRNKNNVDYYFRSD